MRFAAPLFTVVTLLLAAGAWAQDTPEAAILAADKPYATIVARNMFGLLPLPPPDTNPPAPPVDLPPKITPNGIMDIFGRLQALFKVANKPLKPGQPPKDDSYVLAEGERQDGITVVKINKADSIVTFDNHGTIQELPLVPAKDSAPAAAGGGMPGMTPGLGGYKQQPMSPADRLNLIRQQHAAGRPPVAGTGVTQPSPVQPGIGNSYAPPPSYVPSPASPPANIEDQVMGAARNMAEIELNRIATQDAVDQGLMPPLPPTPLTPPDATAHDGYPLIATPDVPQPAVNLSSPNPNIPNAPRR